MKLLALLALLTTAALACTCYNVPRNGLYCGYCKNAAGRYYNSVALDSVAWCNTAGGCTDYKTRTSCARRQGPCNGAQSRIAGEGEEEVVEVLEEGPLEKPEEGIITVE